MKKIFLILILSFCSFCVFAQNAAQKSNLVLTGIVKEIAAQEMYPKTDSAFYIVIVELKLRLENKGKVPIIFFQHNPVIYDAFLKEKDYDDESSYRILAKSPDFRTSSAMFSKDWEKLKKKINKNTPQQKTTTILLPDESINFEAQARFNIPKDYDKYAFLRRPNQNLDILKETSSLELHLDCETWTTLPLLIDGKSRELLKDEFARKLQNKWKNQGYLWFEHIESEPISINFNSIIFKNLID